MLNKKIIVISVFLIIAFLSYLSSIDSSFHLDDNHNIVDNPVIQVDELSLENLKDAAFIDINAGFRPLAYLSFALNYYFSEDDTTSYHVVNIILHALCAYVIYLIMLTLFGYDETDREKKNMIFVSAFFTALFWLVTPFNSQAVIYIVQRMTLMMTLFFLLSFLYYLKGRKKKKTMYFVLSGFFFILSFLSKQNALVFPAVIILYELVFKRKGEINSISKKEKIVFLFIIALLFLPLIFSYDQVYGLFKSSRRALGLTYYERELTQLRVLVFYLSLMVLPLPSRLSIIHDIAKSTSLFTPVTTFFSIIFILGLFVFSVLRIKKSPYFSFALLWFFITMSVEAILPLELMYEHRLHLPSIFLIGASVNYVTVRFYDKNRRTVITVFCAIAIVYALLTGIRGEAWKNEITLWSDVLKKYPEDVVANCNLGTVYYDLDVYDKAAHYFKLGVERWRKVTPNKPGLPAAYYYLGDSQLLLKNYDAAEKSFLNALELEPYGDTKKYILGNLGYIYLVKKDYKKSIEMYKKMLEYKVDESAVYVDHLINMSNSYNFSGDYSNAILSLNKALEMGLKNEAIYSNLGKVYNNLGVNYMQLKKYKEALTNFKKARNYYPNNSGIQESINDIEMMLNE